MKKTLLTTSLSLVLTAGVNTLSHAALANNAVLNFLPGVFANPHIPGGSGGSGAHPLESGSYFGMDLNNSGTITLDESELTAISQNNGLFIGQSQFATGSHSGVIDGSESPGLDSPWEFFGMTGMHLTSSPVNIISDDGAGNVTLDFSGWSVTWNGISNIPMGGGSQDCGTASDGVCIDPNNGSDISGVFDNGTGVATVTCGLNCAAGDTYTLDYVATVPQGSSSFDGVMYSLHLEGTISSVPLPAAFWLFGSGLLAIFSVARGRET